MPPIEPEPLIAPDDAWAVIEDFIKRHGKHNGQPYSPSLVKVMMVGAWIACRFAAINELLPLGVALKGNSFSDEMTVTFRHAFAEEFGDWLAHQTQMHLWNLGFTDVGAMRAQVPPPESITQDDTTTIADSIDEWFRGGGDAKV